MTDPGKSATMWAITINTITGNTDVFRHDFQGGSTCGGKRRETGHAEDKPEAEDHGCYPENPRKTRTQRGLCRRLSARKRTGQAMKQQEVPPSTQMWHRATHLRTRVRGWKQPVNQPKYRYTLIYRGCRCSRYGAMPSSV